MFSPTEVILIIAVIIMIALMIVELFGEDR